MKSCRAIQIQVVCRCASAQDVAAAVESLEWSACLPLPFTPHEGAEELSWDMIDDLRDTMPSVLPATGAHL